VRVLADHFQMRIFALMDADAFGLEILTCFTVGSMVSDFTHLNFIRTSTNLNDYQKECGQNQYLAVKNIQWLGVFLEDYYKYKLPASCRVKLSIKEINKAKTMLQREWIQQNPQYRYLLISPYF
jgi:DNA topoisomerase VI subunit A